jgi:hypothetical protein
MTVSPPLLAMDADGPSICLRAGTAQTNPVQRRYCNRTLRDKERSDRPAEWRCGSRTSLRRQWRPAGAGAGRSQRPRSLRLTQRLLICWAVAARKWQRVACPCREGCAERAFSSETSRPARPPDRKLATFCLERANTLPRLYQENAHPPPCLERKLAAPRGMGHDLRCQCSNRA